MQTLIKIVIILILGHVLQAQTNSELSITVKINNLDSNNGRVFIALYNSQASFLDSAFKATAKKVVSNSCEVTFENIEKGEYAISLFHDENDNGKMDSNAFGIPSEDYGCSNNAKGFMGPPKWEDAKFEVKNESVIKIITL